MAAPYAAGIIRSAKLGLSQFILGQQSKFYPVVQTVRHSRYSAEYLDPTVSKEELEKPLDKDDPRRFQPVKAAASEHTTSCTYDPYVAKFIRMMMKRGKKEIARKCMDRTFEHIKLIQLEKYHKAATEEERNGIELDPLKVFHQAIENCKPLLITQKTRRGGITYTVPVPCSPSYQLYRSMKWLIESCREKEGGERWFWEKLSTELLAAAQNQGKGVRKKQELHRLCEANRAYAHYRW